MSSQTTRTSSPHHLLYRLERKDDVMTVQEERGGGVCRRVNKVFTGLPYWMFIAMLCPGEPEPPGAASGQILQIFPVWWWWWWWCVRDKRRVGPGPGCLACQGYLSATHWLESGSCSARPVYGVQTTSTPGCTMNVRLYATSC